MSYVHLEMSNFIVVDDFITSSGGTCGDVEFFRTRGPLPTVRSFFIFLTSPNVSYVLVV